MMNLESHVMFHFAHENGGETTHKRNNDEEFNDTTVIHVGRQHCDGEHPQRMIVTGCAKG